MGFFGSNDSKIVKEAVKEKANGVKRDDKKETSKIDNRPVAQRTITWSNKKDNVTLRLKAKDIETFMDEKEGQSIEVLDAPLWNTRREYIFRTISDVIDRNTSKYCYKPHTVEVIFHHDDPDNKSDEVSNQDNKKYGDKNANDTSVTANESIHISEARWKFDDIYVPASIKDTIERSLLISRHRQKLFEDWKLGSGSQGRAIVFNFYGPSGTGKSLTGEAIAGELGKKVYTVNYSELESKYVGETPKNIARVFKKAQEDDAVLIFDEADSFLGKRLTNVTQSADYGVNITRSVMLIELEKFDGIVIFTTNLISNYDEAFKRRILASIPFELPDAEGRKHIWEIYLKRGMPLAEGVNAEIMADKYENISGADIKDITLYAAVSALYRDENNILLTEKDFDDAYDLILKRRSNNAIDGKISVNTERISAEQYKEETSGNIG